MTPAPTHANVTHGVIPARLRDSGTLYGVLVKTTVYLDQADYRRLKAIARRRKRSAAELIREAIANCARQSAAGHVRGASGRAAAGAGT